jgi:hypothetical protein
MKQFKILGQLLASAGLLVCAQMSNGAVVKGADVSWTSEIEANGYKYYNRSGVQKDIFAIMKEQGMTAARLRVWVNPADGWYNGTQDVVAKALQRFMGRPRPANQAFCLVGVHIYPADECGIQLYCVHLASR